MDALASGRRNGSGSLHHLSGRERSKLTESEVRTMRSFAATLSLLVALASSTSLSAKGATSKITIINYSVFQPLINITDEAVLKAFQVWAGPGVTHGSEGTAFEETEGFIVDWASGIVAERPRGLPHYEVLFYVSSSDQPAYAVFYEPDSSNGQGYVYLPGPGDELYSRNSKAMLHGHGFEGHWLHASSAWHNVVAPLIASAAR